MVRAVIGQLTRRFWTFLGIFIGALIIAALIGAFVSFATYMSVTAFMNGRLLAGSLWGIPAVIVLGFRGSAKAN